MAKVHYNKACRQVGYFSEFTEDKNKVTCTTCRIKLRLDDPKKLSYAVSRNGYINVLPKELIQPNEILLARFRN